MADLELAAEFWEQLIHTLGPEDSWYYGFSPKRKGATLKRSAIEHTTGVNGLNCALDGEPMRFMQLLQSKIWVLSGLIII